MGKIGMAKATEIVNEARAKLNRPSIELASVRTLLKRNGLNLTQLTPSYLEVEESDLRLWISNGGLRKQGRPITKKQLKVG